MFRDLELFLKNLEKKVDTILEKLETMEVTKLDRLAEHGDQLIYELGIKDEAKTENAAETPSDDGCKGVQKIVETIEKATSVLSRYTLEDAIMDKELGEQVEYDKLSAEDKIKFDNLFKKENEEPVKEELSDMKKDLYFSLTKILKANSKFFERSLVNEEDVKLILESFLANEVTADGMVALQDVKKSHTLWNLLTEQKEVLNNLFTMDGFDFAEAMIVEDFHEGFFKPFLAFFCK
jgi:hypothetical protein